MIKSIFFLLIAALIFTARGYSQASSPITTISLDFPHGETRLIVERNGDASLFYGALPQRSAIKRRTFQIVALYKQLHKKLSDNVPAEQRRKEKYGMVIIRYKDGSEKSYLIYDGEFASLLFEKARKNVVGNPVKLGRQL